MTLIEKRFFGQGCVYLATRTALGKPTNFFFLGDCSSMTLSPTESEVEHREHCTGKNLIDNTVVWQPSVPISLVMDNLHKDNLALFYKGVASDIVSGSVTGEAHSLGADKILFTEFTNINPTTGLVITETAPGSGAIAAADYTASSSGKIIIDSAQTATDVTVDYSYGAADQVSAYTANSNIEYWLRYEGINLAEQESPVQVDIYKTKLYAEGEHSFISEDFVTLGLSGQVLYDTLQPDNSETGRFMKIREYAAA